LWNSYSSILSRLAEKTTSRKGATAANKKATVITPFASLHEDSSLGQLDNVSVRFGGRMKFAKIVFTAAGIWGVVVLTPLYFTYDLIGRQYPPAVTHPDFYYGFLGVALAWQVGFLTIGRQPERLRPMMIPAILEKLIYVISLVALYAQGRIALGQLAPGIPDLLLGCLFVAAFFKTGTPAIGRS
jgi:hypothetical protein